MRIEYEAALVERTVSLAARNDDRLEGAVHAAIDPLYTLPLGQEREARFVAAYLDVFRRLEVGEFLEHILEDVDPAGVISASVENCLVQQALRQRDECAELYVRSHDDGGMAPQRTLIVRVRPESLLDPDSWRPVMLRELKHVVDMLDPVFDYRKETVEDIPARQNLIRDRYRILWDLFVEDRLARAELVPLARPAWLDQAFRRAFAVRDDDFRIEAVVKLLRSSSVTHQRFLDWAQDPNSVLAEGKPA